MTITLIEQAKKRVDRVNIFLDETFWVGLDKNQLIRFELHKGKIISEDEKSFIESESNIFKLREKVINLILIRPRSKYEIYQYLTLKKQVDELTSKKLIETLVQTEVISDDSFTEWFVQNRSSHGFNGKNKIYAELLKKGVDSSIIKRHLKDLEENNDNTEKILKLFEKVRNQVKAKSEAEKHQKIIKRIMARGYGYQEIIAALKGFAE